MAPRRLFHYSNEYQLATVQRRVLHRSKWKKREGREKGRNLCWKPHKNSLNRFGISWNEGSRLMTYWKLDRFGIVIQKPFVIRWVGLPKSRNCYLIFSYFFSNSSGYLWYLISIDIQDIPVFSDHTLIIIFSTD